MARTPTLRKIHIRRRIWKYYLRSQRGNIIIFNPNGQRYEIHLTHYLEKLGSKDPLYEVDQLAYTITPGDIKRFVTENLL